MDKTLDRIEKKIDRVESNVAELNQTTSVMEVHVSRNSEDLSEHIRRTNLLESRLNRIWYVLALLTGAGLSQSGPLFQKLIGLFL